MKFFHVYEDSAGKWRWRLRDGNNNNIVADSGEGYYSKSNCKRAIEALKPEFAAAKIYELGKDANGKPIFKEVTG